MLRAEGRVKMQKNTYSTTQVVKPIKEVTLSSGRRVLTSNTCNVYRGQGHCSGKLVGKIINKPTNVSIRRPRSKPKRKRKEVKFTRLENDHCTVSRVNFKTGKYDCNFTIRSKNISAAGLACILFVISILVIFGLMVQYYEFDLGIKIRRLTIFVLNNAQ